MFPQAETNELTLTLTPNAARPLWSPSLRGGEAVC